MQTLNPNLEILLVLKKQKNKIDTFHVLIANWLI